MPPDPSLATLSSASYSLLAQLLASPSPFPPPPQPSLQAKLRHARQLNKHLRSSLEHTLDLTAARRAGERASAAEKGKAVGDQNAPPDAEEDKLRKKIDRLRREAEGLRGSKLVYERLSSSLDQALLVVGHMLGDRDDPQQIELGKRLARRDALALKLLELTNEGRSVQLQRAEAGRETRLLTRESAAFAKELREAESDKAAVAAMTDAQRAKYHAASDTAAVNFRQVTIVREVFALLVAEAGIEWCFPELLDQLGEGADDGEDEGEGMTDRKLMRLMTATVEDLVGDKEETELGPIAKKRKAGD